MKLERAYITEEKDGYWINITNGTEIWNFGTEPYPTAAAANADMRMIEEAQESGVFEDSLCTFEYWGRS